MEHNTTNKQHIKHNIYDNDIDEVDSEDGNSTTSP